MDEQLTAAGITFQNFDGNSSQSQQTDQINTAIADGYNMLVVNIVETSSPDAAQAAAEPPPLRLPCSRPLLHPRKYGPCPHRTIC